MKTPIVDFVSKYRASGTARLHMPGHKGVSHLGIEELDITEIAGADSLYEAEGIIAQSEKNATELFGTSRTLYSTEGSSQCIRAMLYLALIYRPLGSAPLLLAARNVHKSFVYAAAMLDCEVEWIYPDGESHSLCSCPISASSLEKALLALDKIPAAVYVTSPDYLGGAADISSLAEVCHRYGTRLLVDNAHGAYLRYLAQSAHPIDLGADACCDSAHKTLPVLTGGAYLHLAKDTPQEMRAQAKAAMALFGSTSPSYLTLASLDKCNEYLATTYRAELADTLTKIKKAKETLIHNGWKLLPSDPLRISLVCPDGLSGTELAVKLREKYIECEYSDPGFVVFMLTPQNTDEDISRLLCALGENNLPYSSPAILPTVHGERVCSLREAVFAAAEIIPAKEALGRVCATPAVSCPPAIPIAVSGERIGDDALTLFEYYGIETVSVLKQ